MNKIIICKHIFFWFAVFIFSINCSEQSYTPKPRMYPFINLPEKSYFIFDQPSCPFKFSFPKYSNIEKDSTFFEEKAKILSMILHLPEKY